MHGDSADPAGYGAGDGSPLDLDLDRLARDCDVAGGQLAVHHHGALETWEFGEEEPGAGRPVHSATAFPYGSTTKVFTATSVLQLVGDGDLDLDRPVREWLPEAGTVPEARKDHPALAATLRQLLSHTAGLPSDHDDADASSLRRWLTGFLAAPTDARPAPGTFSYSNVGYGIAGRVVESVTGLPWYEAVRDYLLRPLGTAVTALPAEPGSLPAGGLAGSAADLVRLGLLHVAEPGRPDLADPAALGQATRPTAGADPFGLADGWGPGLGHFGPADNRWLGHDGTLDGATCHLRIHPRRGTVVALTTNSPTGQALWDAVVGALRDAGIDVGVYRPAPPPSLAQAGAPAGAAAFADCTGTYRNGELAVTVGLDGPHLVLELPGGARELAEPLARRTFAARGAGAFLGRFAVDARTGAVHALQYSGRTLLRDTGRAHGARLH